MAKLSPTEPLIHAGSRIVNSTFGAYCEVGASSIVVNSAFADHACCDRMADIANTGVGRFSNIAALTRIGPTDHPHANAAQHHFLHRSSYYRDDTPDDPTFFAARASRRTSLGSDCRIGHGAIIKPETSVGIGAIVAAGAVVTRDVGPFMIVAGCPATLIRARFSAAVIDRLPALAWWGWDHARLRAALTDFRKMSAEAFLDRYEA